MPNDPVKIKIKNYQSIEDIEFVVDGLTVISGRTNVGKSSVVRAISSALLNRPVTGAVRKGAKYASVSLDSSSYSFLWEKGERDVNRYTIGEKTFDAIGRGQFSQVKDYGFGSVEVGDSEIHPWLAEQFFPLFLIDKPGTQVTDFISSVSRLNVLQDAVLLSSRGKKGSVAEAVAKESEVADLLLKEQALEECGPISIVVEELESQRVSIETYEKKIESAEQFRSSMRSAEESLSTLSVVHDLVVPDGSHGPGIGTVFNASSMNTALKLAAESFVGLKPVLGIVVPEIMSKDMNDLLSMERFTGLSEDHAAVEALSRIYSVVLPELTKDESETIVWAETMRISLLSIKTALARLTDAMSVKLPETPEDPAELSRMTNAHASISAEIKASAEFESKLTTLQSDLSVIEAVLSTISVCPTCDRPVDSHA